MLNRTNRRILAVRIPVGVMFLQLCFVCPSPSPAQQPAAKPAPQPAVQPAPDTSKSPDITARALALYQKRMYPEAIKLLQEHVKNRPEAECGRQFLVLAECYYQTDNFEQARPYFVKAGQNAANDKDRILVEYRLAGLALRLNDTEGALEKISSFITKYPNDSRVGDLLVYKMQILSRKGKEVLADLEAMHKQLRKDVKKLDSSTSMKADQVMSEYYRKIGEEDKARDVFASIVQNFQKVIADLTANNQPVPPAFEKYHDNAAIQLGAIYVEKKQANEAMKWLENVRYDIEMKQKARLLLAKLAFESRNYAGVSRYLAADNYVETVPQGPVRSDMFLLLGLAEKNRSDGNPVLIEQYLKGVDSSSKGFYQAQSALGDIYREKGLENEAIKVYTNCFSSTDYAANALYYCGNIYFDKANRAKEPAKAEPLYQKAGEFYNFLIARYPLSPNVKEVRKKADILAAKGVKLTMSQDPEQNVHTWEQVAAGKKGEVEGAQALMSIVRYHFKTVAVQKTGKLQKAPDYAACAAACDKLLDETVYKGNGFEPVTWKNLRAEAFYHRGKCEVASVSPPKDTGEKDAAKPVYLKSANVDRAMGFFKQAKENVDQKQLDLARGIEIGLLEAMFKSVKKEVRQDAEKRFQEMEADYGDDSRFQALGLELAEWCRENERFADAARHYAGAADRGRTLPDEDILKLRYASGSLYSKAAYDAQQKKQDVNYVAYVYPKEVIDLGEDLLKSYEPLKKKADIKWPDNGKDMKAETALVALSKAIQVPFIWATAAGENAVDTHLKQKKVTLQNGPTTGAQALETILDTTVHKLAFDLGVLNTKPTIEKPKVNEDDPEEAAKEWKIIEIYDARQPWQRYKPFARKYGVWEKIFANKAIMLFKILERMEEVSETHVLWAEGIDKQEKLALEFKQFPQIARNADATCWEVLSSVLASMDLRFRILPRDVSADYYESAKEQFSKIRQVNPRSKYGEKSIFALALNYYNQKNYEKMKIVLREYLKLFDNSSYEHYRAACFWVGWAFENEKKYREACDYYARAAEERIIIYKLGKDQPKPGREQLTKQLSYDTQCSILLPVSGEFQGKSLSDLADFARMNTHLEFKLDAGALSTNFLVDMAAFTNVPLVNILCDALEPHGLSLSAENVEKEISEKSYFRMASCYRHDGMMPQALENANMLLARYPNTTRRKETYQMMLDIYKGLKDYGSVVAILDELRKTAGDDIEKYKFEYEKGSIYYDMADYTNAAAVFKSVLASASGREALYVREAYARALFRAGNNQESLAQFQALVNDEREELRLFVDKLMVFYLKFLLGNAAENEFPDDADQYIRAYQKMKDEDRGKLSAAHNAKVAWIYYIQGLVDLRKQRVAPAVEKLDAATRSPDDSVAADAGYRVGMLYMEAKNFEKAKTAFEYLLVFNSSAESAVRATYALGQCLEQLGKPQEAAEKYKQLVERYPLSPYVQIVKKNPLCPAITPKSPASKKTEKAEVTTTGKDRT